MSLLSHLLILALATSHILEVWRHGKIMQEWRAWMETEPLGETIASATLCTFCFSVWVAWCVTLVWPEAGNVAFVPRVIVFGLAVARTANLINDIGYSFCRTPKQ